MTSKPIKDDGKRKPVAFTKAVKKFIITKMSEGYTVAEIHRKWPDKTVKPNTVYKKAMEDPEWDEELNKGYSLWHYCKLEELDRLSTGLASELYPNAEFREAEAALKRRIDTLKFSLGKMAPIMAKRFDKAQVIDHKGLDGANLGPVIQIMDYSNGGIMGSITKGVTIDNDDDQ